MIAFIKGTVSDLLDDSVILENQGMGYRIFTSSSVLAALSAGDSVTLHSHLNVREDAMQLYGFLTRDDLEVFRQLITVSGIGPKAGIAILSVMTGNDLRYAIMAGDSKSISKAPGVGAKTAQKVILELKDKLKVEDMLNTSEEPEIVSNTGNTELINEAVLALAALGYSQTDAMRAVRQCSIAEGMSVEELLKLALKQMLK